MLATKSKKHYKKIVKKLPPKNIQGNLQYDLFTQFVSNDKRDVSNTVELWERIPKYFFTGRQVEKLRTPDGLAKPYQWQYEYDGAIYRVDIQPAMIETLEGQYKAFFPGVTEELVEEALKKIFSDQRYGLHYQDKRESTSWVRFTLGMVQKELSARGRTRSIREIKQAIKVMSRCNIVLHRERKEIWSGAILQDLVTVDREEYIESSDSYHVARLPLFISEAIDALEYRQYNYVRLMQCDRQLARWIYKQLIHRFIQASTSEKYHFLYSSLERDSGLLQQATKRDNRKKVLAALEELKICGVLFDYEAHEKLDGRKVEDVKYTLRPSLDFTSEQKAANKRKSIANKRMTDICG